uniref:OSJNBa0064M23.8 protein n=1 Tax=Oryza sativa subsp. japonica TaxID=39947 RepID=Q7X5X5_ORYSJ|nr:OSJNBa0064M23.8 [Oryza sativa Japonica Group]
MTIPLCPRWTLWPLNDAHSMLPSQLANLPFAKLEWWIQCRSMKIYGSLIHISFTHRQQSLLFLLYEDIQSGLFGPPDDSDLQFDENNFVDIPQVSQLENEALIQEFTKKEIKEAIFQMEHNKAPGPDGFPAEFYQVFWNVIKDMLDLFRDFHNGTLSLFSLNFGTIILLPKCAEAMKIQQYRPICLLNVSFKIFTKVATNRIMSVAQKAKEYYDEYSNIFGCNFQSNILAPILGTAANV